MYKMRLGFLAVGCLLLVMTGCGHNQQQGIGGNVASLENITPSDGKARTSDSLAVLLVTYDEAMDIAYEAARSKFGTNAVTRNLYDIVIRHSDPLMGNVKATITPKLVKNLDPGGEVGCIFDIEAFGVGKNYAYFPGYVSAGFFSALKSLRTEQSIKSTQFRAYKIMEDKGIAETIPNRIPTSYDAFLSYLDRQPKLNTFEGIWADQNGNYVLGIIENSPGSRFNYTAFILSSKRPLWSAGEVKIKFDRLRSGAVTLSKFHDGYKRKLDVGWRASSELLVSLNIREVMGVDSELVLVKRYPVNGIDRLAGVGTGWAISEDGLFVTNAHVIEDADEILIGLQGGEQARAEVLATDTRLDLAILRTVSSAGGFQPLPIAGKAAATGTDVTVMGYPLAFELGDDTRVTTGVISAQTGYDRDITRYQISAAIQGGNSGGPVLNDRGQVVGIVVSSLAGGEVQNVNFAIKSAYLRLLLDQAGIRYSEPTSVKRMSTQEIVEAYRQSVLPVWTKR